MVFLTSPAEVTLSCGSSKVTTTLQAGSSKLKLLLTHDGDVAAKISRDGNYMEFEPKGFSYSQDPPSYNFNAFVAASP